VDVVHGVIKEKIDLFIEGDTITDTSSPGSTRVLNKEETIDLEGAFLVPGLIDLHVHLIWSAGSDPARTVEEEGIQVSLLRAALNARQTLAAGITTVRDLGSNENTAISLAKAIERGYIPGPRVIASGCTIIMTGGHDPFWGRQTDGITEVLKAVREQVRLGARVIKVSATGGVYGRSEGEDVGRAELTAEELKAICDEAHRFGLKVAAHSISEEGIWNCIRAGIDSIEHGHFLKEDAMEQMRENVIFWVPTLYVYKQIATGEDLPVYAREKAKEIVDIHRDAFRKGLELGVPLACGSDAGSPNTPHTSLIEEMGYMVACGCATSVALRAATYTAAKALDMEESIGSLDVGKRADLLAVRENPLEDIAALRNVVLVIKDGRPVRDIGVWKA
jgi:imidazolonepropionase-like amidohydrolase